MNPITVEATINSPIQKVWDYYTTPEHITQWAFADESWEAPHATNDLKVGGKFVTRMQAKDKSAGFDFTGTYTAVELLKLIEYDMDPEKDEKPRHVKVEFTQGAEGTKAIVTFDPESENPEEFQKQGWQAILNNFKNHTENS